MRIAMLTLGLLSFATGCGLHDKPPKRPVFGEKKVSDADSSPTATVIVSPIPAVAPTSAAQDSDSQPVVEAGEAPRLVDTALEQALAAFQGKTSEAKGLKIYGHSWNIKAAKISKDGPKILIEGQISHAIRYTFDDQVSYRITLEGEEVTRYDIQFVDRNWVALSELALPLASSYVAIPFSTDLLGDLFQGLDELLYQDWKDQAKVLILQLANASSKAAR